MKVINPTDQAWLDHCAEMNRLHDVKAAELVAAGWRKSGPKNTPRFCRDGITVELRRQLGSAIWYTVEV
jgi:hypothetical protein